MLFKDIFQKIPPNIKLTILKSKKSSHHNRLKLIRWLFEVSLDFSYSPLTVINSIPIIDNFNLNCDYQLLGITSLFISAKLFEKTIFKVKEYCLVTDCYCKVDDILELEKVILNFYKFELPKIDIKENEFFYIIKKKYDIKYDKKDDIKKQENEKENIKVVKKDDKKYDEIKDDIQNNIKNNDYENMKKAIKKKENLFYDENKRFNVLTEKNINNIKSSFLESKEISKLSNPKINVFIKKKFISERNLFEFYLIAVLFYLEKEKNLFYVIENAHKETERILKEGYRNEFEFYDENVKGIF